MTKEKYVGWQWKPKRWWTVLLIFLLVVAPVLFFIGLIAPDPVNPTALIRMVMIGFLIVSIGTERVWSVGLRLIWVISCYILHILLMYPSVLIFKLYYDATQNVQIFDFLTVVAATLPIIVWAMRRSTYFVQPNQNISKYKR